MSRENSDQPLGLSVLAAMHDADRARGIDPYAVEASPPQPQQTLVEQGLRIEPPDWDQERREAEARERDARVAEATALLEEATPPPRPDPPAPKQRRPWPKFS